MPSKNKGTTKLSSPKRSTLPRRSDFTSRFEKDWATHGKAGRFNMSDVKAVMALIVANEGPLPAQHKDHELSGKDWAGCRECHVHGDCLLVYRLTDKGDAVIFTALGTHNELFGR